MCLLNLIFVSLTCVLTIVIRIDLSKKPVKKKFERKLCQSSNIQTEEEQKKTMETKSSHSYAHSSVVEVILRV